MRRYKQLTISVLCLFNLSTTYSQSAPKKVVVEHFTNTRCSVCASRNPGFYSALDQNSDVIHVAFHPSSPYSTCLFSTQNKVENDARTNWYGLFGGTPTFAINGSPKNINEVSNASVYQDFKGKTTPISLSVSIKPFGSDSIEVNTIIKSVVNHNLSNLQLYVILAEDTVFYNSPNGEKIHRDVFRKSFTGSNPLTIILGNQEGNQYTYSKKIGKNSLWNLKRCYAIAMLHEVNKSMVQAGVSSLFGEIISAIDEELRAQNNLVLYPNPTYDILNISLLNNEVINYLEVFDDFGKIMTKRSINENTTILEFTNLAAGFYIIKCGTSEGRTYFKKTIKL